MPLRGVDIRTRKRFNQRLMYWHTLTVSSPASVYDAGQIAELSDRTTSGFISSCVIRKRVVEAQAQGLSGK